MLASYNRLLTDVTPGAPMHRAFKKFWHPVMHANRLEADGAPIRFTLLCEKYVAFRATDADWRAEAGRLMQERAQRVRP